MARGLRQVSALTAGPSQVSPVRYGPSMNVHPRTASIADRYVRTMRPCLSGEGFDRERAIGAVVTFVRDMEEAHAPPATIVQMAVDLLPLHPEARGTVWAISLRDWARTAVRETLRAPVFDRRSAARDVG